MELVIGQGKEKAVLLSKRLNQHGIISGATGTGKTVTLKVIAEQLSDNGIPVFLADVKGDLSGLGVKGEMTDAIAQRVNTLNLEDYDNMAYPVQFWDVFANNGIAIRTTVSEMGPVLLSQLLGLNDTQEGILNIVFKLADEEGLLLIDLKDLRAALNYVSLRADELRAIYGNITAQSTGAILRSLLVLEQQGGDKFFGEPSFDIKDLLHHTDNGKGVINILSAEQLFLTPKLYAAFLLWFLSELYENMEEVGQVDKPKMVFFFDEAHILFNNVSGVVLEKIELIVRLIRSKGIGIFFVTQNPLDIPDSIGSQLGNRIQHGMRAFTPKEQKNVRAIAETFRQQESEELDKRILSLQVGEAVVSFLDDSGTPTLADTVTIYPPKSHFSPMNQLERQQVINQSTFYDKYAESFDRESAHEQLNQLEAEIAKEKERQAQEIEQAKLLEKQEKEAQKEALRQEKEEQRQAKLEEKRVATPIRKTESPMDKLTKNLMATVGREVGRVITRGVLGMFSKKK